MFSIQNLHHTIGYRVRREYWHYHNAWKKNGWLGYFRNHLSSIDPLVYFYKKKDSVRVYPQCSAVDKKDMVENQEKTKSSLTRQKILSINLNTSGSHTFAFYITVLVCIAITIEAIATYIYLYAVHAVRPQFSCAVTRQSSTNATSSTDEMRVVKSLAI